MKSYSVNRYHQLQAKYIKYKKRLDNAIESGRFKELRRYKQYQLVRRIRKIQRQLQELVHQIRLAGLGAAIGLAAVVTTPATAQDKLDFVQINDNSGVATSGDVAMDADGDYVVVWLQDGEIFARLLNSYSEVQSSQISVAVTTSINGQPKVAMDDSGGFLVAWQEGNAPGGSSIHARRFQSDGNPYNNAYQISNSGWNPSVALDDDGDAVIVFTDYAYSPMHGNYFAPHFVRRSKSGGNPSGGTASAKVSAYGFASSFSNGGLDVTMDATGNFTVAYMISDLNSPGDFIRLADFTSLGYNTWRHNLYYTSGPTTFGNSNFVRNPKIAGDDDGDFVVSFFDSFNASDYKVTLRFNGYGYVQGYGLTVDSYSDVGHDIAMDADGDYAWVATAYDGPGSYAVYSVKFNQSGANTSYELHSYIPNDYVSIASDDAGDYVIVLKNNGNIYAQQVIVNPPLVEGNPLAVANSTANEVKPKVGIDDNGNFIVVWLEDDLMAQIFTVGGTPITTPQTIANGVYQDHFDVDMDSEGDFVITWERQGYDEINWALYSLDATYVSYLSGGNFAGTNPAVSLDADGDFFIAYEHYEYLNFAPYFDNANRIKTRFFNSNGTGGTISYVASIGKRNYEPDVAIDETGEAIVVYIDNDYFSPMYGYLTQVMVSRMNSGGSLRRENLVFGFDTETTNRSPTIATDADGDFVVAWNRNQSGGISIMGRRFENYDSYPFDIPLGGSFNIQPISNYNSGNGFIEPFMAMAPDGDFMVSTLNNLDGNYGNTNNQIVLHRYDPNGYKIETITFPQLQTSSYNYRGAPIAGNDKNTYAIVWQDQVGTDEDINAKLLYNGLDDWAPTDIDLSNSYFDENQPVNTLVADLSTDDLNPGDTHTYSLTANNGGGADNDNFYIANGNRLYSNIVFDHEGQSDHSIQITSTDPGGLTVTRDFNIFINNLNDPPTITNSSKNVTEGVQDDPFSDFELEVTDEDTNFDDIRIVIKSLPSRGTLKQSGSSLAVGSEFSKSDWDGGSITYSHDGSEDDTDSFTFDLDDGTTTLSDQVFTLNVQLDNDPPVVVNTGVTVLEGDGHTFNQDELGANDPDTGPDNLTFTLTALPINGSLILSDVTLSTIGNTWGLEDIINGLLTYLHNGSETGTDTFTFSVSDGTTEITDQIFNIAIDAVNDVPSITTNIEMNLDQGGTVIITNSELFASDDDDNPENRVFTVNVLPTNGKLFLNSIEIGLNGTFTQQNIDNGVITYTHNGDGSTSDSFGFKVTDEAGAEVTDQTFNFTINEPITGAPTDIGLSANTIDENSPIGTIIGFLSTTDGDVGDSHTYSLTGGDADAFNITGNELKAAIIFDFETKSSYSVEITSTDASDLTFAKTFDIAINDLDDGDEQNEAPTGITLSNKTVPETAGATTVVGRFSTKDPNAGDTFTYGLTEGGEEFNISGNQLRLNGPLSPEAYEISVTSTDAGGLSVSSGFRILVKGSAEVASEVEQKVSYGTATENFRLISMPFASINAANVFPELSSTDFGKTWKIVGYRNGREDDATSFTSGRGYWFLALEPTRIEVQATDASPLNGDGEFEMSLTSGWNIIGNPFLEDISSWSAIVQYNKDIGQISDGDILNDEVIYKYNGQGFPIENDLATFEGAWIEVAGNLTIRVPVETSSRIADDGTLSKKLTSYFDNESNWQLVFDVRSGTNTLNHAGFGIRSDATQGVDYFDMSTPPSIDEFGLKLSEKSTGLAKNLVNPTEGYAWIYKVSDPGADIILNWDKEIVGSVELPIYLTIPGTSQFYNMKEVDQVILDRNVQEIQVLFGNVSIEKSGLFTNVFPNPVQDRFTLEILDLGQDGENLGEVGRNQEYELEIFGLNGQTILKRQFTSELSTFRYTVENINLNSGVYLYRLKSKTAITNPQKLIIE